MAAEWSQVAMAPHTRTLHSHYYRFIHRSYRCGGCGPHAGCHQFLWHEPSESRERSTSKDSGAAGRVPTKRNAPPHRYSNRQR
ncbi:unnamed protein product [Leptidea sinapis]|uniref:Uncharacterized protein n=1 Tax=Leptidea sinapis TaxID=189913 RepID=A0A5E4QN75_9NEOP|nr:unnamed protein product [Leptidea sinapis]